MYTRVPLSVTVFLSTTNLKILAKFTIDANSTKYYLHFLSINSKHY